MLKSDGSVAANFACSDAEDQRDPVALLISEGVRVENGKADPAQELGPDAIADLLL